MQDCTNKSITSNDKGLSLHSTQCWLSHLEYWCAVLVPTKQKRCDQAGENPEEGYKDDQRAEKLKCEEQLRDPGLFSLWKRRL